MSKNYVQIRKIFGENVKKYRTKAGLTQEELAYRIKRDTRSIVDIETGRRNTTMQTIYKLALVLKVPAAKLLPF